MRYASFNAPDLVTVLEWLEDQGDVDVLTFTHMNFDWVVVIDTLPKEGSDQNQDSEAFDELLNKAAKPKKGKK